MSDLWEILKGIPWYAWLAFLAVGGGIAKQMLSSMHRHDERMAQIEQGKDPSSDKPS